MIMTTSKINPPPAAMPIYSSKGVFSFCSYFSEPRTYFGPPLPMYTYKICNVVDGYAKDGDEGRSDFYVAFTGILCDDSFRAQKDIKAIVCTIYLEPVRELNNYLSNLNCVSILKKCV